MQIAKSGMISARRRRGPWSPPRSSWESMILVPIHQLIRENDKESMDWKSEVLVVLSKNTMLLVEWSMSSKGRDIAMCSTLRFFCIAGRPVDQLHPLYREEETIQPRALPGPVPDACPTFQPFP